MRDHLAALSRILAVVNKAALWTVGIGLVLMTLFVSWQIFGRYVLNQSPSWTEPASLLLMSWFILLGSAVRRARGQPSRLRDRPPLRAAELAPAACSLVTEVLVIGFGVAMAWYGTRSRRRHLVRAMPGLPISQGVDYVPLAVRRRADRALRPREARPPPACRRGGPVGSP